MNDHTDESQYEDDKISALYKQGSVETPASHVNDKIKQHARSHSNNIISLPLRKVLTVISTSRVLAVAAVVVLSVSVILQIQFDHPDELIPASPELQSNSERLLDRKNNDTLLDEPDNIPPALETSNSHEPVTESYTPIPVQPLSVPSKQKSVTTPVHKKPKQAQPKPRLYLLEPEERRVREQIRQQRMNNLQQKKQDSMKKRDNLDRTKKEVRSEVQSLTATGINSPDIENCQLLTNMECMVSLNCSFSYVDETYRCKAASNICETNFSQLLGSKDQCESKELCEYNSGHCECDTNSEGLCACTNNELPSCDLSPELDEGDD